MTAIPACSDRARKRFSPGFAVWFLPWLKTGLAIGQPAALVQAGPDTGAAEAARSLLASMWRVDAPAGTSLNARELDVLRRLETQPDKRIAAELGLSTFGVRHHIRKLFVKLGVRKRGEAVRRARELGLLADEL